MTPGDQPSTVLTAPQLTVSNSKHASQSPSPQHALELDTPWNSTRRGTRHALELDTPWNSTRRCRFTRRPFCCLVGVFDFLLEAHQPLGDL